MEGVQGLIYTAVFLGVLITVHEGGHFFAAKWANVKVEKFSIGFGNKLFGFRRGETEYQIALFPLGGFVKMAGMYNDEELPETDAGRTYLGAPWWKRVTISLAGPAANLLFSFVALFFVFLWGERPDFVPRIGSVEPGSPAAVAGLKAGDLVVAIDGSPIRTFTELSVIAGASANRELQFTVDRSGSRQDIKVTPASVETLGVLEVQRRGRIGITSAEHAAVLGVPFGSAAQQAGLETFDRVVQVDGVGLRTVRELEAALNQASGTVQLEAVRFRAGLPGVVVPEVVRATIAVGPGEGLARIGAERGDAYVWEVRPLDDDGKTPSPAAALGIKVGDRFTAINGQLVHSAGAIEDRMALAQKRRVEISWVSGTETHTGFVGPLGPEGNARYCMRPTSFGVRFGAPGLAMVPLVGQMVTIDLNPLEALNATVHKLPEGILLIGKVLSKLSTGEVPLESMGGPLQIAQIATQTAEQGWADYLSAMALVSVNLALVNLLPIPILDGFNILIACWEAIRRRPPSMRVREVTTYLGFAVLAVMMVIAWRNDIARLIFC